ncbi:MULTISPECIES: heavy metal sensor histidine kinase [Nitrosospira]|uniref:Sensor protein n=1 Tax=Nitrosospira multiformis TaxID=1231 RepID=A0ABY0T7V8_9PROT|nr:MULTISPECIES: heavy metal sensor histidine kinase [Nitrosospira]SDQ40980.1 two-component system, OmpR family, heavy metal sensor histidine kinase CusS [Nitrosospira multiformis]
MRTDNLFQSNTGSTHGSISRKLAWLYALSASAMLFFTSGFLYWVLITTLEQEDEHFLRSRLNILETILREQPGDTQVLEREITEENIAFAGSQHLTHSRILDESGRTLHESRGMKQEIPTSAFPSPETRPPKAKRWRSDTNKTYWLIATWAEDNSLSGSRRQIQVALDETEEELLITRYEYYLFDILLVGILVSVIIGILITQRSMKPLADITGAAERITASQLHERLNSAPWPRELALLTRALDSMLGRLEDSFNRLSQFSADLAHELRTPLNNLRGEAEVALSKPREAHEYREILASSLEEYDRMSRMLDSLLFLARADSEQAVIALSLINARTEIEKIIVFYEAVSTEKSIRVLCEGDATTKVDPDLFQRAISNLLANALYHTPDGGSIIFSIDSSQERGTGIICRDSGIGIAQEHLPKIFDRFYRINPSRNGEAEGAGLGLAIVKSIIGLHGGNITVQSVIGEGTAVRLFFPA